MNRQTIILANWKCNGGLTFVSEMATQLNNLTLSDGVQVILCPSFPYLSITSHLLSHKQMHLGAQNVCEYANGPYTGEVSADMLLENSVKYVVVGHSERRRLFNETSLQAAKKVKACLAAGLIPVLCIGENEAERNAGQTEARLISQLQPVIDEVGINSFNNIIVAYEPNWAIGTGKNASPEVAQETHAFIRGYFAERGANIAAQLLLLYGGSVNAKNHQELFAQPDIDGGLIGGASLNVEEFVKILSTTKG